MSRRNTRKKSGAPISVVDDGKHDTYDLGYGRVGRYLCRILFGNDSRSTTSAWKRWHRHTHRNQYFKNSTDTQLMLQGDSRNCATQPPLSFVKPMRSLRYLSRPQRATTARSQHLKEMTNTY